MFIRNCCCNPLILLGQLFCYTAMICSYVERHACAQHSEDAHYLVRFYLLAALFIQIHVCGPNACSLRTTEALVHIGKSKLVICNMIHMYSSSDCTGHHFHANKEST